MPAAERSKGTPPRFRPRRRGNGVGRRLTTSHHPCTFDFTDGARGPRRLLGLVLIAGLALRLHGVSFGLPALNDPDELMFELGAIKMLRELTLNPGWFGHPGTTTIYVLALLDVGVFAVGHVLGWFPTIEAFGDAVYIDPGLVILPGRAAMVLFGLAGIFLTYRLARNLFDPHVGTAAAALLAVNPIHIQYSQIIRTDIMANCFMLLSLLAALRIARAGRWSDTVWASLWLALAVATKWPFAIAALAIVAAVGLRMQADNSARDLELRRLALAAAMTLGFLLLISPYLLLDSETVLRSIGAEVQTQHVGATGDGPLANALWYLTGPLLSGLGLFGALLAAGGTAMLLRRREALAILAPVSCVFFLIICVQNLIWERWALPLMPLLAIVAGLGLVKFAHFLHSRLRGGLASAALAAIVGAALAPPATDAVVNARERVNDTRQMASAWLLAHASPGQTVLLEHFAFDLVNAPYRFIFPLGEAGCVDAVGLLRRKVGYDAIERLRQTRSNVDFGTLAAERVDACRADYAILTHYDRYLVERSRFPAETANYAALLSRGEQVATFTPDPGRSGGPIVRIIRLR